MYQNRDTGINHIKARKDRRCYGMGIGIIILDEVYPGFPGDVRNASAYPFPIQYEIVENVDIPSMVYEEDKSPCLEPIQRAAKKLEKMGCRAIAAECGYFAYFQKEIAGYVDVPVFMSRLLQAASRGQNRGQEYGPLLVAPQLFHVPQVPGSQPAQHAVLEHGFDPSVTPVSSGWGVDAKNTRFQPQQSGGLSATDVPALEVKWAFAYPNAIKARSQPGFGRDPDQKETLFSQRSGRTSIVW